MAPPVEAHDPGLPVPARRRGGRAVAVGVEGPGGRHEGVFGDWLARVQLATRVGQVGARRAVLVQVQAEVGARGRRGHAARLEVGLPHLAVDDAPNLEGQHGKEGGQRLAVGCGQHLIEGDGDALFDDIAVLVDCHPFLADSMVDDDRVTFDVSRRSRSHRVFGARLRPVALVLPSEYGA